MMEQVTHVLHQRPGSTVKIEKHDESIEAIFEAIRQLMTPPEKSGKQSSFDIKEPCAACGRKTKRKRTSPSK